MNTMEKQLKKDEGKVSNVIAWVLLVLQFSASIIYVSELCSEGQKFSQIVTRGLLLPWAIFLLLLRVEMKTLVGLICQLIGFNAVGIGGLILGLQVWLKRGNKKGKTTIIAAIVTILLSSILYYGCYVCTLQN